MASSSSIYDFSIEPMTTALKNILAVMVKAEEFATEKGDDIDDYLELKLIDDMKPFSFQIQRISDSSKFILSRIGGTDDSVIAMEDNEKTWAELKSRLERTIKLLDDAKPDDFVGKESIEVSLFGGKYKFTGLSYVQHFAVPNFYFHATTAYDLLRMKGVQIGKIDFLTGAGPPNGMST